MGVVGIFTRGTSMQLDRDQGGARDRGGMHRRYQAD